MAEPLCFVDFVSQGRENVPGQLEKKLLDKGSKNEKKHRYEILVYINLTFVKFKRRYNKNLSLKEEVN